MPHEMRDRILSFDVSPARFGIFFSRKDRAVILGWLRETGIANIVWVRLITFKLALPPFRHVHGFMVTDEG